MVNDNSQTNNPSPHLTNTTTTTTTTTPAPPPQQLQHRDELSSSQRLSPPTQQQQQQLPKLSQNSTTTNNTNSLYSTTPTTNNSSNNKNNKISLQTNDSYQTSSSLGQPHQQQQQQQQSSSPSSFLPKIIPQPQNSQNSYPTASQQHNQQQQQQMSPFTANNYRMTPVNHIRKQSKQQQNNKIDALDNTSLNSVNSNTIKVSNYYGGPNNTKNGSSDYAELTYRKQAATASSNDSASKKIVRWHLWWDRSQSNLRVPSYELPSKNVPSKIGSLDNIEHRPGGGNIHILNENLKWSRRARTDHLAKGYRPGGGNLKILNEKLNWNVGSKIGSLDNINHKPAGGNVSIVDMPFDKSRVKPKIDSGFVFEEVIVPVDYVCNSPRQSHFESSSAINLETSMATTTTSQNRRRSKAQ